MNQEEMTKRIMEIANDPKGIGDFFEKLSKRTESIGYQRANQALEDEAEALMLLSIGAGVAFNIRDLVGITALVGLLSRAYLLGFVKGQATLDIPEDIVSQL